MRLQEGVVLDGRYTLEHRLGAGGMADVWRAEDAELGRPVALKVLHENFARDTEFVERFRREASAAAGLHHPNLVGVFDRGEVEDTYYIAMEYVDGSSLRDLIGRGITIEEAIEVTRQVLAGAQFAHSRGVVHRDLKPLNVLIDREGRIRVTDFGIARAGGSEITRTGSVMGTAQYLSPEQAQGMDVTPAADIYSIGVMLFEMLTGRVPFDGDSAVAVAMKQVSEPPPAPSSINPAVTPALDAVVLKALAKDPAERYDSAADMLAALDQAEANPTAATPREQAPVPIEQDRRRWWWIAAVVAALLIAGGLAWALTRPDLVKVPSVTGLTETAATLRLQNADFEVEAQRNSAPQPAGTVIEQDPRAAEEAEKGSTVTISVSLGPAPVAVPDVTGLGRKQARKRLERAGFEVEFDQQPSESVPAGKVIETSPPAGTEVRSGETVTATVSSGSEAVAVPDVIGLDRIEASAELEDAGFLVNSEPKNADEPEDQVIDQLPPAGTSLEVGETVTIVYSTGAGSIVLDDYVGFEQGFAERKLGNRGLEVSTRFEDVDSRSDDGIVLRQSPSPGTRLSPGDRVSLVVGRFVAPPPGDSGASP
jgi:beta-lactam-binding protein with PASTA domain